jgi:hypothetical protein
VTEAEWLACTEPTPMLKHLLGKASSRKLGLFACACARHGPRHWLGAEWSTALVIAERFADGLASDTELQEVGIPGDEASQPENDPIMPQIRPQVWRSIKSALRRGRIRHGLVVANTIANAVLTAANDTHAALHAPVGEEIRAARAAWAEAVAARGREEVYQSAILRDVVGNPFRPAQNDGAWVWWNDRTVWKVAQATYDDRAFDRLPILADALEEAGCTEQAILDHCRGPGPHARGCWVLDLLLGKA